MKIQCIEAEREDRKEEAGEKVAPIDEIRKWVGFVEPNDENGWNVTLMDGTYSTTSEFEAYSMANQEMIKAMLMQLLSKTD